MKKFNALCNQFKSEIERKDLVEFLFILRAWFVLSKKHKLGESAFSKSYEKKITAKQLTAVFKELSAKHKLFKLYNFDTKLFSDSMLVKCMTFTNNEENLPPLGVAFDNSGYYNLEAVKLALALANLECSSKESGKPSGEDALYVPFANDFFISANADGKVFSDGLISKSDLVLELLSILEGRDITFIHGDNLKNPPFKNPDAPHILRQFQKVVSLPQITRDRVDISKDNYGRFDFFESKGKISYSAAALAHALSQCGGRAVVLMPASFVAFGGQSEQSVREFLLNQNLLESVIMLPTNFFGTHGANMVFFVINKNKKSDSVFFLNLRHDSLVKKDGRKTTLANLNDILKLYKAKEEREGVSVSTKVSDIIKNHFSLNAETYLLADDIESMKKKLGNFKYKALSSIAQVRRSQALLKNTKTGGSEIYEISPSDLGCTGYITKSERKRQIANNSRLESYKLEAYDVLISTKGSVGKVGIIGKHKSTMFATQSIDIIRPNAANDEEKRRMALYIYAFLRSKLGRKCLESLIFGTNVQQISTQNLNALQLPVLNKEQLDNIEENFQKEIDLNDQVEMMQAEVQALQDSFLIQTA